MKKILALIFCLLPAAALAQVRSISGTVTSEADGSPVGGVMVLVEGTSAYAMTDTDGRYAISATEGDTLTFDLLGYTTASVTVGLSDTIDVLLSPDATAIEELVVVGYGIQRKSVVTAAIGSVKASELETQTPTRLEGVLQGKVAGVNIVQSSGQPGSGSTVRIRGIGTTTGDGGSDPLYIIDGMQVSGGIDQLNPTDIASIEVLKDAASAAVYGTRGANGVILVTTKRGQTGAARVTYDMQMGWQNPWKLRGVLNSREYQTLMNEASLNAGEETVPFPDPAAYRYDTNWQKELFNRNAPIQNHQLSVSGANDNVNYYVSAGYFQQEGIIGGNFRQSNYDRLSLRTNSTYKLMDHSSSRDFLRRANLGINAMYAHTGTIGMGTNGVFGERLGSALLLPPTEPVFLDGDEAAEHIASVAAQYPGVPVVTDNNGRVFSPAEGFGEINNPIAQMYLPARTNWADKFVSSLWADIELYKGLVFKSSYGVDMAFWGWNEWSRPYYLKSDNHSSIDPETGLQNASGAAAQFNRGFDWQLENTITYQTSFGRHGITVLLGQSARGNRNSTRLEGRKAGLQEILGEKAYIDFTTTTTGTLSGGPVDPYRLASYFGRVSYNYNERYMVEVTARRDGSSRFGPTHKWGTFPSVSVGWNITGERFAEVFPLWISSLKLRASWGQNGNDRIGNFEYTVALNSADSNRYIWGPGNSTGDYKLGVKPSRIANEDLTWEASEQTNIGLDASFLNSTLNFSFDWYRKITKGMLIEIPIPTYVGDSKPRGNVGDMLNSGVEIEIDYRFSTGKWDFGAHFNATYLRNRVKNLGNAEGYINRDNLQYVGTVSRDENGFPFHFFYGRRTAGIFQTQAQIDSYTWTGEDATGRTVTRLIQPNASPGDVIFLDLNNDGQISDADRTMIGKFFPDWTYNFSLTASWRDIDASLLFQGVAGSDIFDATRRLDRTWVNLPSYMLDRWTGPGTSNSIPRMNRDDKNGNWLSSDLYVQNGAYLRLKTLQIGYTIPQWISKKAFISRLRVYFMAENLVTITRYRGFDPEMDNGFDRGVYPQPRTISVGLNLGF
ncbi:MAG: TonB-dependent receptor [Alistipes sp.]|jgi:TonB-linked SusC/RagA family outer membrane protein|nr:TonB-dependent receptor [Alistipes sp.]